MFISFNKCINTYKLIMFILLINLKYKFIDDLY